MQPMLQNRRRILVFFSVTVGIAAIAVAADWWMALPEGLSATYVGRANCAECHAAETLAWTGSDHDRAMDLATEEAVLGDFDDREFTYQGVTSRMFRREGKFFIHTESPHGRMEDFPIKYTFGVRPLQQYMVEFPDGRVQVLRVSWDTERKAWFYIPPPDVLDERIEPGDPLHWTGAAQNWNHTCAECHSTNFKKNYDLAANTYRSTFSEIDVSCEACHGPGSVHVELARAKSLFWDRRHGYGLAKLKGKDSTAQLETCAQCHSRRSVVHGDYRPGRRLLDHYEPVLLYEGLYHADGQILDEVYVYGSFLQSKMHREVVRCTDCHDPHTARIKFDDNQLCTQCHSPGKYDSPTHHHHPVGTGGALCVECHMPETTYMVVDPRRDHSLRVPRPDLSVSLGVPNACNRCHTKEEETAEWAAAKVREWYGPTRPDDPHPAPAMAAARAGKPEGEDLLLKLLRRRDTPGIVRATAISLLPQYPSRRSAEARERALTDADPLVRATAARTVAPSSPGAMRKLLVPLLSDPFRTVRTATALRLLEIPRPLLTAEERVALDAATQEYKAGQLANSDRAASHLNLGNLYQRLGQTDQAVTEFRTAVRLEPYLAGARSNLASLLELSGEDPTRVRSLREEELKLLERNARMLSDNAVAQYRHGLMLYLLGRADEAEEALAAACRLSPGTYDYRLMLALLYEKQTKWDAALESIEQLLAIRPGDQAAQQVRQRILQARPGR